MTAHQRAIREQKERADPRPVSDSLEGYSVDFVTRDAAEPLILEYEWLGELGRATAFVGLLSPDLELHGVACFGHGPAGGIRDVIGSSALCLERGACVHYAPKNAASFLINRACRLMFEATTVPVFFAYCDPNAGEYGGVYQAAGWLYLGQGLNGSGSDRARRFFVLPPGADPENPANWKTTRALRRGERLSFAEARERGWRIETRPAKHVYATNVGPDRRPWRRLFKQQSYPAPEPALKRAAAAPWMR